MRLPGIDLTTVINEPLSEGRVRLGVKSCSLMFFEELLKQSIIPDTCLTISVDYIRRFPIFAHDSSIPWSRSVSFSFDRDDFGVVRECVNKRHLGRRYFDPHYLECT